MTESQNAFDAYITSGLFGENKAVRSNELTWYKEKYSADIARDFKLWQAAEAYGRKQALEELEVKRQQVAENIKQVESGGLKP
jgi:hypothetical protein